VKAAVVTVSDGVSEGTREDESGEVLAELLAGEGYEVERRVVSDDRDAIADAIAELAEEVALVLTTGGTGLGPRDVTPQATASVIDYDIPGLTELMRRAGLESTPMAALTRGLAGVRGQTLVINVPGSPKGAVESLEAVMPVLEHALALLRGDTKHE